jgi:hypothetical protein
MLHLIHERILYIDAQDGTVLDSASIYGALASGTLRFVLLLPSPAIS